MCVCLVVVGCYGTPSGKAKLMARDAPRVYVFSAYIVGPDVSAERTRSSKFLFFSRPSLSRLLGCFDDRQFAWMCS